MGHESLIREHEFRATSDRSFGFALFAAFSIVGLLPLFWGENPRWWALIVASVLLLAALVFPPTLAPLNRAWAKVGLLLQRLVSPIVLGFSYFLVITPLGLIMRLLHRDLLRLRSDPAARSYWIERIPPGPSPESLRDSF
jgi:hypothetical protein